MGGRKRLKGKSEELFLHKLTTFFLKCYVEI